MESLERHFNKTQVISYATERWHYSFHISAVYMASVFLLQRYMQHRKRFNLRLPLFMWSLTLALFSMVGSAIVGPPMISCLFTRGWESSICERVILEGQAGLWAFLFCFSKLPELVDTYFIVLRKQKLIFLHWYHHVTVFIYCWYHYVAQVYLAQWFITLNYIVHSIMYTYYALRASGRVRPPVWVNMIITVLQLVQMVLGVGINLYIYMKMEADSNWYCDGKVETSYFYVYWAFAMYFSYFVLFVHFFWSTYFSNRTQSNKQRDTTTDGGQAQSSSLLPNDHLALGSGTQQCKGLTQRHAGL